MTLPTGFAPRSWETHMRMAHVLAQAPAVVSLPEGGDGWMAAWLAMSGRVPVWGSAHDSGPVDARLRHLGLGGLGHRFCGGSLRSDMVLRRRAPVGVLGLPPVGGPVVSVLLLTKGTGGRMDCAVAGLRAQRTPYQLIVLDRSRHGIELPDGAIGVRTAALTLGQALCAGLESATGQAVLVLRESEVLMPGALRALSTVLFREPRAVAALGDVLCMDGRGQRPTGYRPALRGHASRGVEAVVHSAGSLTGRALIRRSAIDACGGAEGERGSVAVLDLMVRVARRGDVLTLPLPVMRERADDGQASGSTRSWSRVRGATHQRRDLELPTDFVHQQLASAADRDEALMWCEAVIARGHSHVARPVLRQYAGPHGSRECTLRRRSGLPSSLPRFKGTWLLIDDGDDGALESMLHSIGDLEAVAVVGGDARPQPALARRRWPAAWHDPSTPLCELPLPAPWLLRLASSPEWRPPCVIGPAWLPRLRGTDAVLTLAAALGWDLPMPTRGVGGCARDPAAVLALEVRALLSQHEPGRAAAALRQLRGLLPGWAPLVHLAADVHEACGHTDRARELRAVWAGW